MIEIPSIEKDYDYVDTFIRGSGAPTMLSLRAITKHPEYGSYISRRMNVYQRIVWNYLTEKIKLILEQNDEYNVSSEQILTMKEIIGMFVKEQWIKNELLSLSTQLDTRIHEDELYYWVFNQWVQEYLFIPAMAEGTYNHEAMDWYLQGAMFPYIMLNGVHWGTNRLEYQSREYWPILGSVYTQGTYRVPYEMRKEFATVVSMNEPPWDHTSPWLLHHSTDFWDNLMELGIIVFKPYPTPTNLTTNVVS